MRCRHVVHLQRGHKTKEAANQETPEEKVCNESVYQVTGSHQHLNMWTIIKEMFVGDFPWHSRWKTWITPINTNNKAMDFVSPPNTTPILNDYSKNPHWQCFRVGSANAVIKLYFPQFVHKAGNRRTWSIVVSHGGSCEPFTCYIWPFCPSQDMSGSEKTLHRALPAAAHRSYRF